MADPSSNMVLKLDAHHLDLVGTFNYMCKYTLLLVALLLYANLKHIRTYLYFYLCYIYTYRFICPTNVYSRQFFLKHQNGGRKKPFCVRNFNWNDKGLSRNILRASGQQPRKKFYLASIKIPFENRTNRCFLSNHACAVTATLF